MRPDPHPPHLTQPHAIPYRAAPVGEVTASEAGLAALAGTRPWAMMAAIVTFIAGAMGVLGGAVLLIIYAVNNGRPGYDDVGPANVVVGTPGLIYGTMLLVASLLLASFIRAARRTTLLRRPEDLERMLLAQLWFWRWAAVCLLAWLVSPFVVFGLAVVTGAWD